MTVAQGERDSEMPGTARRLQTVRHYVLQRLLRGRSRVKCSRHKGKTNKVNKDTGTLSEVMSVPMPGFWDGDVSVHTCVQTCQSYALTACSVVNTNYVSKVAKTKKLLILGL